MGLLKQLATAKAYQDGFEDGKEGKTPRFVYLLDPEDQACKAYQEGYAKGEKVAANNQHRIFLD